jgi:hypothetical protein
MFTRFIAIALFAMAAAASPRAAAQAPTEEQAYGVALLYVIASRDGASPFYSGVFSWTNHEDATESVNAYVSEGRVECKGTYRGSDGVQNIDGVGLIEILLGQGDNDRYSIRVACPNATTPGEPADFRHSVETYEQPGGTVQLINSETVRLPLVLEGSRSEPYDNGGGIRMTWRLCHSGCAPPEPADRTAPPAAP